MEQTLAPEQPVPAKRPRIKYPIRAPYNFIPFPEVLIARYEDPSCLPPHDVLDEKLESGEIRLRLTAKTPVFVSDSDENDTNFFRDPRGRFCIPASTMRGLIRMNMQILGCGTFHAGFDFKDSRLFHHNHSDEGATWTPVRGGYLYYRNGTYFIRPVRGTFLTIPRCEEVGSAYLDVFDRSIPVYYREEAGKVTWLSERRELPCRSGVLLCPSRSSSRGRDPKAGNLYLFPPEDREAETVILSPESVMAYQEDFAAKRKLLRREQKEARALPKRYTPDGEGMPVFFQQKDGFTIIGKAKMLRLAYDYSIGDGIPAPHQNNDHIIDYPDSILGFYRNLRCGTDGKVRSTAYRSRVRVDDLIAEGQPQPLPLRRLALQEPRLRFHDAYVKGGVNYNTDGFVMSGCKQYWMKPTELPREWEKGALTGIRPLPEGTTFTGTIRYQNLHPDELGLLLWCLRLEEGCMQTIGMGKPYGYGRMELALELRRYDLSGLYRSFEGTPAVTEASPAEIEGLIRNYDHYASRLAGVETPLGDQEHIRDFLYMKRTVRDDVRNVSYMSAKEHTRVIKGLQTVRSIREAEQHECTGGTDEAHFMDLPASTDQGTT
jgi:hypothetical protein